MIFLLQMLGMQELLGVNELDGIRKGVLQGEWCERVKEQ